jgi:hypothetical protein
LQVDHYTKLVQFSGILPQEGRDCATEDVVVPVVIKHGCKSIIGHFVFSYSWGWGLGWVFVGIHCRVH